VIEIARDSASMFTSGADALVNPVNTVGVMGAGLAKEFAQRFPEACQPYFQDCKAGFLSNPGSLSICSMDPEPSCPGAKWIIHFPTKRHWREPSNFDLVRCGLFTLQAFLLQAHDHGSHPLQSIAIPALGCGLGGLPWLDVKEAIQQALEGVPQRVILFPPKAPLVLQMPKRHQMDA
jgi:O-acetyl-ADP-ribose deacetylase (regulator of RNase III)